MSDVLIRGISRPIHIRIQKFAQSRNLSVNQMLIELIERAVKNFEEVEEQEKSRQEAFERARRLREEIYRKYGKFDDSTKLIREDRDNR
ncbi:MAG: hypothetical protein A3C35_02920 [Omnitrophica bacterium RIFCSPHIGHO2_02_FULL_46_11]|nr:MAG: hypothetical protein A3C35_02920 [Omnitrophica bacterium RIFCSPHIGHO2_02_FULL_46_11]OGW84873.1 MAG: hypothetical protein A3A81_00950 [Omnitrophica bacterium RIFCSPLOWO2_01_FULL_45_10b]